MNYLIFYVKHKECDKPIEIVSFSRSTEIYQYFMDTLQITSECKKISVSDIREVLSNLSSDIYRNKMRLETYEKYAHMNADLVEEVIGVKEYLGQLTQAKFYMDFIMLMAEESEASYSKTSEICCAVR